ncbi:MAG: hypothetical protein ACI9Y7_000367 [Dokdonia sp.]|jgi:hypothetical protein
MRLSLLLLTILYSCTFFGQDAWTSLNDFPFNAFTSSSFVVGEDAYVVVREGQSQFNFPSTVYAYDVVDDSWTLVADIPEETLLLEDPFVIDDRVFFIGLEPNNGDAIELWEFDVVTNTFNERAGYDFGGFSFSGYSATSFAIDGIGYLLTSASGGGDGNSFIGYNPETDTWTVKTNYPGYNEILFNSFATSTKGYVLFGFEDFEGYFNDLWEYDPTTDSWMQKTSFPNTFLIGATSFVIQDQVYVGSGWYNDSVILYDLYRRYNPTTDTWESIEASPFLSGNPFSFVVDGMGYVGLGSLSNEVSGGMPTNEIWRLDPTLSITDINVTEASIYPNPVTDMLFIESSLPFTEARIYSLLGQALITAKIENNQLDVSSLSKGVYFLQMTNETGVFKKKLIKN